MEHSVSNLNVKRHNTTFSSLFYDNSDPCEHGEKEKWAQPKSGADTYNTFPDKVGKEFTALE
jgi:hypothetical protein